MIKFCVIQYSLTDNSVYALHGPFDSEESAGAWADKQDNLPLNDVPSRFQVRPIAEPL